MLADLLLERDDVGEIQRGHSGRRALHEFEPDWKRSARSRFLFAKGDLFVVKADPHSGGDLRRVADKPRVGVVLRRAGFSRSGTAERLRLNSRTELNDFLQTSRAR